MAETSEHQIIINALTSLKAFCPQSAVYAEDVVDAITEKGVVLNDTVGSLLLDLHKQRITVFGYDSVITCYQKWYVCQNPPSERRSWGNYNGHCNLWSIDSLEMWDQNKKTALQEKEKELKELGHTCIYYQESRDPMMSWCEKDICTGSK